MILHHPEPPFDPVNPKDKIRLGGIPMNIGYEMIYLQPHYSLIGNLNENQ